MRRHTVCGDWRVCWLENSGSSHTIRWTLRVKNDPNERWNEKLNRIVCVLDGLAHVLVISSFISLQHLWRATKTCVADGRKHTRKFNSKFEWWSMWKQTNGINIVIWSGGNSMRSHSVPLHAMPRHLHALLFHSLARVLVPCAIARTDNGDRRRLRTNHLSASQPVFGLFLFRSLDISTKCRTGWRWRRRRREIN